MRLERFERLLCLKRRCQRVYKKLEHSKIVMSLKKDIIKACLLFRENNYSFPYKSFVTTTYGKVNENHRNQLYSEFKNRSLIDFVECLADRFQITIHFLNDTSKIQSKDYGKELFMRKNQIMFWFHSNCARMINLPAGVNKLEGPCHRLDEIIEKCCHKKCKMVKCPLRFDGDLSAIEAQHNISFNIWSKTRADGKYNIECIRRGDSSKTNVIDLHHDPVYNKLFLITGRTLYFRSFLRKLNKMKT